MKNCWFTFILFLSFVSCQINSEKTLSPDSLNRIKYNHEGLTTDLGVGLWAWPVPFDYDNDGDYDLLVSCNDKPYGGLYFFENPTGHKFPTFKPAVRVADQIKNIQISYSSGKNYVLTPGYILDNFRDSLASNPKPLFPTKEIKKLHSKIRFNQWKMVDYENDGDMDIIVGIDEGIDYGWDNAFDKKGNWTNGPLHGFIYLLLNNEGSYQLEGKILAGNQPIDVYGSPSPNMADFDGDGDLDIICGEFIDKLTWFENIGTREKPSFKEGSYLRNDSGFIRMHLEMIIPTAIDWDKDGDIDLVIGDEDGRVAWTENTGMVKNGMPLFKSPHYFQQEADNLKFGALVTPFSVDWDNDGDEDLICGNSAGNIAYIENMDGGNPPKWNNPEFIRYKGKPLRIMAGNNGSIQGPCESKWGYTTLSVADWDGDGKKDLIVNSIWGKVVWYKNIGKKLEVGIQQPIRVDYEKSTPKPEWNWWNPENGTLTTQWRTTPYAIDWNKDGLTDLIMLDQQGYLCFYERYNKSGKLKLKTGKRIFHGIDNSEYKNKHQVAGETSGSLRLNISKYGSSGRRKFCFADWDQDGDLDLLVNSINISLLENIETKNSIVYFKNRGELSEHLLAGHTTNPTIVDWDKNSIPDLLIGAEDGHFYFLENPHSGKQ